MTRIRTHRTSKYFTVSNATAQDPNLSFTALGLLTYCLSMPGDWNFNPKVIWKSRSLSRNKTYAAFDELIINYRCIRIRKKKPNSNLPGDVEYEMFDDVEDCKARAQELLKSNDYIEFGPDFNKCFRRSNLRETGTRETDSRYITKETPEETKETTATKEEDPPPLHSAVPLRSAVAASSKIYDCLAALPLSEKQKKTLTKRFTEDAVKHAISWVNSDVEIKKSLIAAITWAAETKPEIPKPKEDIESDNRSYAIERIKTLTPQRTHQYEILHEYVSVNLTCNGLSDIIRYDDKLFKKKLDAIIKHRDKR